MLDIIETSISEKNISRIHPENTKDKNRSGGEGGDGMESRVAKLESDVSYIKRDIEIIQKDVKSIKKTT